MTIAWQKHHRMTAVPWQDHHPFVVEETSETGVVYFLVRCPIGDLYVSRMEKITASRECADHLAVLERLQRESVTTSA